MNKEMLLKATKVTKTFEAPDNVTLLHGIDLTLYEGESVAIIGQSGEGKSTLLHILATLDTPTTGSVELFGNNTQTVDVARMRNEMIGFVFQAFHLLNDVNCIDNLVMPSLIGRHDKKKALERAHELLERVHLGHRKNLIAAKLSGGEKQRLAIARAFMNNPKLLFADEPTGNLDHQTALEVQSLLFSWVKEEKKALLLVTHNQDLARKCDRMFTLESGLLN